MKEETTDRTLWKTRFGKGCGPFGRQTAEWMNTQSKQRMGVIGPPPFLFHVPALWKVGRAY